MESVDPRVHPALVSPDSIASIANDSRKSYDDLPTIRTGRGQVITRWTLTTAERRLVFEGEDIYITLLSHGPINPICPTVGPIDWNTQPLPQG